MGPFDELEAACRELREAAEELQQRHPGTWPFVSLLCGEAQQVEYDIEGAPDGQLHDIQRDALAQATAAMRFVTGLLPAVEPGGPAGDIGLPQEHELLNELRAKIRAVQRLMR